MGSGPESPTSETPSGSDGAAEPFAPPVLALVRSLLLLALMVYLMRRKTKGFQSVVAQVEEIRWAGDNWTPPKLIVGSYAVSGR